MKKKIKIDLNKNNLDPVLQEFIDWLNPLYEHYSTKDMDHILQDIRDTCTIRIKELKR